MNFNPLNLNRWNQWLNRRQLQVLEAAHQAAQNIKALEDNYFDGGKITYAPNRTKTLVEYVQSLRDRQLFIVRTNLAQFRLNSFFLNRQSLEPEIDLAQPESLTNEPIVDSDAVGLCRKNDLSTGNPPKSLFLIKQFQKVETRTLPVLAHLPADAQFRDSPDKISQIQVRSRSGSMVRLNEIAKITPITGPQTISHFNLFRAINIQGNAAPGHSSGEAIQAMQQTFKEID